MPYVRFVYILGERLKPRFHFAKVDSSPRLQRLLAFMRTRGGLGATGIEIATECSVLNPATYLSELRHNGFTINCIYGGRTESGQAIYRYFLLEGRDGDGQDYEFPPP